MRNFVKIILFVFSFFVGYAVFARVESPTKISDNDEAKGQISKKPGIEIDSDRHSKIPISPTINALVPSNEIEREPEEWQGMLASEHRPPCASSDTCGMALACIDEKCSPCSEDIECDAAEKCVLQHCILEDFLVCRKKRDCKEGEFCILSGYSSGIRGNIDMKSSCVASKGGRPQVENKVERELFDSARGPYDTADITFESLSEGLKL